MLEDSLFWKAAPICMIGAPSGICRFLVILNYSILCAAVDAGTPDSNLIYFELL